jgi:hypothetical protein
LLDWLQQQGPNLEGKLVFASRLQCFSSPSHPTASNPRVYKVNLFVAGTEGDKGGGLAALPINFVAVISKEVV